MSLLLAKHGMHRQVAVRKPLLTAAARQKRLDWARVHSKYPFWKWRRTIFSDEKIFRWDNNTRTLFVTRTTQEKYHPACVQPTLKNCVQVHAWGAVSWNGVAPLKLVRGYLNAQKYQNQVINDLRQVGQNLSGRKRFTFQQDRAPAHSARTTRDFISAQGIDELAWPGNSPDLNIMENLWAIVAHRVEAHPTLPKNEAELWERVQVAWNSIPLADLRKLFHSIPLRIQETINAHGGTTRY